MKSESVDFDLPVVVFDEDCALCRTLAAFAATDATLRFQGRKSFFSGQAEPPVVPDGLIIITRDVCFLGRDAWQYLLDHHKHLKGLSWISRKFGIENAVAASLEWTGFTGRRWFCRSCPK